MVGIVLVQCSCVIELRGGGVPSIVQLVASGVRFRAINAWDMEKVVEADL